jgi:hypothetical protein
MTYDLHAKQLAIKAIGTVESNLNYTAINYSDPITVGFMQWYGTRAAGLLSNIRTNNASSWVGIPASLTNDLDAHATTDANFWTNRYLSRDEGEPLRNVLNNNKSIQNDVAISDLDSYANAATRAGMNLDGNTDAVLFFFVMYHQSPRRALGVVASAGPASDMARLLAVCLNEPVLGQYRTRYNTAASIIAAGDTSGIDPTPGPSPDPPDEGGDVGAGTGQTRVPGPVRYVSKVGDALHVHLAAGGVVIVNPTNADTWLPVLDRSVGADVPPQPDNPDPTTPPVPGGGSATQTALVEFVLSRAARYSYSQGASRLNPEANLSTDCSGLMYYTYQTVAGINIGTYTGNQYTQGTLVAETSGTLDESLLQPGDLVFFDWVGGRSTVDHVDMYVGSGNVCGHGGPGKGPVVKALAPRVANAVKVIVRRHVN